MGLPAYVFFSLCHASNTVYRYPGPGGEYQETEPLGREIVALPEICVDSFDVDVAKAMRPVFNVLRNLMGQDTKLSGGNDLEADRLHSS